MNGTRPTLVLAALLGLAASAQAQITEPTTLGPKPGAEPQSPDNHVVKEGDTLWDLSGTYMQSTYEWPRLWSYNPEITNPHWIYPGYLLRLREGADGGYATTAPPPGAVVPLAARAGYGAGFGQDVRFKGGSVVIGEEVYLDKSALAQTAMITGAPEEQMFLSPSDQVYLKVKKDALAPETGKLMTVFIRRHRKEVAPYADKVQAYRAGDGGEIVRVLGTVRIESFDAKRRIAKATIIEARDVIERGHEVADVPTRLAVVEPKTNERKVEARVIAANHPLGILGQGQIVFINAGSKKGVAVGNRFFVVRQGDDWRENLTLDEDLTGAERPDPNPAKRNEFPWEVVAEVRVLYVRPETSTAVITGAVLQVEPGDRVEMREGY